MRAKARGAFVVGLAGQVPLTAGCALNAGFDALIPIGHRAMTTAEAIRSTADNLRRTALQLGNLLAWVRERRLSDGSDRLPGRQDSQAAVCITRAMTMATATTRYARSTSMPIRRIG